MTNLTDYEAGVLEAMRRVIVSHQSANTEVEAYYEGNFTVKNLGIAVPPTLADIGTVSDWPATVIDVHHERMIFEGWLDGGRTNIGELETATNASLKISEALLDAMLTGVGFIAADVDGAGQVRLHTCSPRSATMLWDYTTDRAIAGMRTVYTATGDRREYLYLPGKIITVEGDKVIERRNFPLLADTVPMVRLRNRLRPRRFTGQSEITKAVRYYTDAAVRTLLGMEINREFYTTPQRWAMNADMSLFGYTDDMSESEEVELGWRIQAGKMLSLPPPEMGDPQPQVGQFTPAPPTPYIEQIRTYSQLLASATGIPSAYLGFSTENPPSGDAIRAWTERLVRAVEAKQAIATPDIRHLGWIMHRLSGGTMDYGLWQQIEVKWRDAATPTKAADADAATKLVAAGVLPPDSTVTMDRVGLSPAEQRRIEGERRRGDLAAVAEAIRSRQVGPEAQALSTRGAPAPEYEAGEPQ